jgi:hypothetical protein
MLTESKAAKEELLILKARVLDLTPRSAKLALLALLYGHSLDTAIEYSQRMQTISAEED